MEWLSLLIGLGLGFLFAYLVGLIGRRGGNAPGRAPDSTPEHKQNTTRTTTGDVPGFAIAKYKAKDGSLDKTFNGIGKLIHSFNHEKMLDSCIHDLGFDASGRLGAAGEFRHRGVKNGSFAAKMSVALVWLDVNGTVVDDRGTHVITPDVYLPNFDPSNSWFFSDASGHAIQFDTDRSVLATGAKGQAGGANSASLARFGANLRPDSGFATSAGVAPIEHRNIGGEIGTCCAAVPSPTPGQGDRVVAAVRIGSDTSGRGPYDISVVGLSEHGLPDSAAFQTQFKIPKKNFTLMPTAIAVDNARRIVVAGLQARLGHANLGAEFVVARFEADGTPDTTFGAQGKTFIPTPGSESKIARIAIDKFNRIVLAGWTSEPKQDELRDLAFPLSGFLARLNENGKQDKQFSATGNAALKISGRTWFTGVCIDKKNRIVVCGGDGPPKYRDQGTLMRFVVTRFLDNGDPDPSFPPRLTDFGPKLDSCATVVITDAEDDIYVGGGAWFLTDRPR